MTSTTPSGERSDQMNTAPHQYVGEMLHDRIIGALELCCRRGEMLLIQNKRINWDTCQIGIPGATAKDKENRRIPERTARGDSQTAVDSRARCVRLRQHQRRVPADNSDGLGDAQAAGERHHAEGFRQGGTRVERAAGATHRLALARSQARRRVPAAVGRRRHPHHPADARSREHSADAALLERDG